MVWNKIMRLLGKPPSPKIVISGLKRENEVFKESIQEEAEAFLVKATEFLSDVESIIIHVKSSGRGNAAKFELHSLLSLPNASIRAKAVGRKLNLVLKDLFDLLLREARKKKSKRDDARKRGK